MDQISFDTAGLGSLQRDTLLESKNCTNGGKCPSKSRLRQIQTSLAEPELNLTSLPER